MSSDEIPEHLPRGRACQACRMRKMKCDGNPPVCNQCSRFGRPHECVFVPGPAPSNTRMLEHEINRLQARIEELELREPTTRMSPPGTVFPSKWWEHSEPPRHVAQTLIQYFAPHAAKFGFFLDIQRFSETLARQSSSASGPGPRIPTVLRTAAYLWGIHLSRQPDVMAHENVYLDRTIRAIQGAMSTISQRPEIALYVIQAEVLLAYYFFDCNRPLEGQHHSTGAMSLAITCGLHKFEPGRHAADSLLPAPANGAEEAERINAWWQVFILEKCWTTILDTPSVMSECRSSECAIDTPWPCDQGGRYVYGRTIRNFFANVNGDRSSSLLAMYAKAAALYEKAGHVASLRSRNTPDVASKVTALDTSIEAFKSALPGLANTAGAPPGIRHDLLVVHTLAECAAIALHKGYLRHSSTSRTRCINAANTIVRALQTVNSQDFGYVSPILAVTCSNAHEILLSALRSLRGSPTAIVGLPGEDMLKFSIDVLKNTLSLFAANSAWFVKHLTSLREAQASLR
ncbi:hypothetical protein PHLGIDRAFT_115879 [Phlebiopsis gigantea 11061_1 CR5-6]|uniref:Zn(2)-C6 fungal-type domain-containing protein n=1 Tax=Phlebiopsis gigantea (strain 11061_1 CR5-6) TaxID=745531 RepID=A0A0C3PRV9_PHLG1|nr:hypothetical protein PHLGIDRAFT_115879 [Phlebiopsis gigantea 11061_1 CR5-6]